MRDANVDKNLGLRGIMDISARDEKRMKRNVGREAERVAKENGRVRSGQEARV